MTDDMLWLYPPRVRESDTEHHHRDPRIPRTGTPTTRLNDTNQLCNWAGCPPPALRERLTGEGWSVADVRDVWTQAVYPSILTTMADLLTHRAEAEDEWCENRAKNPGQIPMGQGPGLHSRNWWASTKNASVGYAKAFNRVYAKATIALATLLHDLDDSPNKAASPRTAASAFATALEEIDEADEETREAMQRGG